MDKHWLPLGTFVLCLGKVVMEKKNIYIYIYIYTRCLVTTQKIYVDIPSGYLT